MPDDVMVQPDKRVRSRAAIRLAGIPTEYPLHCYICAASGRPLPMELGITGYIILFAVSLFVLLKASDWFISAAEKIGLAAGISPFIIR